MGVGLWKSGANLFVIYAKSAIIYFIMISLYKIVILSGAVLLASVVLLAVLPGFEVLAQSSILDGVQAAHGQGQPTNLFGDTGIITSITNTLLFVAGSLAVIMIIWGGLRYVVSGGNASAVTAAKNTILYAIVGLIIAFFAFAVVNWLLGTLAPGTGGGAGFTNV